MDAPTDPLLAVLRRHGFWRSNGRRIVTLAAVLFVVGVLFALGVSHPHDVRITGRVVAHSVYLRLSHASAESLALNAELALSLEPGVARVSSFSSVSPGPTVSGSKPSSHLTISAPSIALTALHVAEGGTMQLFVSPSARALRVMAGGGAAFEFETASPTHLRLGSGLEWQPPSGDAGSVITRSEDGRPTPMVLDAHVAIPAETKADQGDADVGFMLEDVSVDLLRFGREMGVADLTPFVSSIDSGEVTLVGTGDKLPLDAGSPLRLDGFVGHIVHLALQHDGWHLIFTGRAKSVRLGPVGFEEDVTPTRLQVLSHIQWVQLACAAIGVVLTTVGALFALKG